MYIYSFAFGGIVWKTKMPIGMLGLKGEKWKYIKPLTTWALP
jgi:hypothetical protein